MADEDAKNKLRKLSTVCAGLTYGKYIAMAACTSIMWFNLAKSYENGTSVLFKTCIASAAAAYAIELAVMPYVNHMYRKQLNIAYPDVDACGADGDADGADDGADADDGAGADGAQLTQTS